MPAFLNMSTRPSNAAGSLPEPLLGEVVATWRYAHKKPQLTMTCQAFENTSTNVAAAQMRNSLTALSETVTDPKEKKVRTHTI